MFFSKMEHNYICIYDSTEGELLFTFRITSLWGDKGWVWCQLTKIERRTNNTRSITVYDPEVHDGTSHYMGHPYKARYNKSSGRLKVYKGDNTLWTCYREW